MDKIKRFLNCTIPITACNLRCGYCFVTQGKQYAKPLESFPHTPEYIAKALSFSRLGGACLINLCGLGETMLPLEITKLTRLLLEQGHYVAIVTNGTIKKRFEELCALPHELLTRLFIKFSFHYIELRRLNLLDVFFENVHLMRSAGVSISLEIVSSDNYVPYLEEIKKICSEKAGACCHVLESRNAAYSELPRLSEEPVETHQKMWSTFNSALFEYQQSMWGIKQNGFCFAGEYSVDLNLWNGEMRQCNQGHLLQNIYENVEEPLYFCAIGTNCPSEHCFICYVWQTLCNNILELPRNEKYADLRNRICIDGSEWLSPKVKVFFEQKVSDNNEPYSNDKKTYVDALMAFEYGNEVNKYDLELLRAILERRLKDKGVSSVAIWGINRWGQWLYSLLMPSIKVKYIVDCDYLDESSPTVKEKLKRWIKYTLKNAVRRKGEYLILNRYDRFPKVDAVIIPNYPLFGVIKNQLESKMSCRFLSITELAD